MSSSDTPRPAQGRDPRSFMVWGIRRPFFIALSYFYNALYTLRYRRFLKQTRDRSIVFLHSPKTAGMSIAKAMNIGGPGHFTYEDSARKRSTPIETIMFTTRDPADRVVSLYKMSKMKHLNRPDATLYPLRFFRSADEFVLSDMFDVFVKYNYAFKPQYHYIAGALQHRDAKLAWIRFDHLAEDMKRHFDVEVPFVNKSPQLDEAERALSPQAVEKIGRLHEVDYVFLKLLALRDGPQNALEGSGAPSD